MPLAKKQDELVLAVLDGDASKVEVLLSSRVDPNCRCVNGDTPLHLAAGKKSRITELLLDAGADIEAMDGHGRTPLHVAAYLGNTCTVEILIKAGADPKARDYDKRTPLLHFAERTAILMTDRGKDYVSVARLLLDAGADINAVQYENMTALMFAAREENLVLMKFFVQRGADMDTKCKNGNDLLYWAKGACEEWLIGLEKAGNDNVALDELLSNDFPSGGNGCGI